MITYEYSLPDGTTLEVEQPITDEAYVAWSPTAGWHRAGSTLPQDALLARRLVSGGGGFRLSPGGSGWARDGYAPPLGKRKLNSMGGR